MRNIIIYRISIKKAIKIEATIIVSISKGSGMKYLSIVS